MGRVGAGVLASAGGIAAVAGLVAAVTLAGPAHGPRSPLAIPDPTPSATPSAAPDTWDDPDWGESQLYAVQDDGTLWPTPTGDVQRIWSTFEQIATPDYAIRTVDTFGIGDAENSDLLAYVWDERDGSHFGLAVNLAGAEDEPYLAGTLIHEYGHLLSLSADQMGPRPTHCETFSYYAQCARKDAYLAAYQRDFWSGYTDAPGMANDDEDVTKKFYDAHEGDFVDEYAATNLKEDFAETFMVWVIEAHPDDAKGRVADKLDYFDGYPALVAIRDRIRREMGAQLGDGGWPGFGG